MRRFFVPVELLQHDRFDLPDATAHHIGRVLRLQPGDAVALLDGAGTICHCTLETGANGLCAVVTSRQLTPETALPIDLYQGLPKADKMELILQKGTELGLRSFLPVISERTIVRQTGDKRLERWRTIVQEAARQSQRLHLPRLDTPQSFTDAVKTCTAELKLLLWEEASEPLEAVLPSSAPHDIALLVGPEGGFSPAEAATARAAGFVPVGCGPRILRTETAALAVAAVLQYLFGDLGHLPPRG